VVTSFRTSECHDLCCFVMCLASSFCVVVVVVDSFFRTSSDTDESQLREGHSFFNRCA